MSKFTSKAAARKDAQKQGKSLGEIEIVYHEKAKMYTWKLAEVAHVTAATEPAKDENSAKKPRGKNRARFRPEQIITVLADKNPKRAGSASYKIFEYYENGQTVEENMKLGGHPAALRWDVDHKFISIE